MIACLLPWPHLPPILFTLTCEGRRGEERRRAEGAAPLHQIPITKNRPNRQSGWMTKRPTIFHGAPAPRRPVHCHQNGDHYIASLPSHCPTARPRPPASPSGATSSETNSVVWIWMTTSSMTETRSRAQRPTEAEEGGREGGRPFQFTTTTEMSSSPRFGRPTVAETRGVSENRFPLVIIIFCFIHLSIRLKS